jgi:hypothetical protein
MAKPPRVPATRTQPIRALIIVPDPDQPGLTRAERLALTLRRDATASGRCACGATAPRVRAQPGAVNHRTMRHEHDCPAADGPVLEAMVERLGSRLEYVYAIVEFRRAA